MYSRTLPSKKKRRKKLRGRLNAAKKKIEINIIYFLFICLLLQFNGLLNAQPFLPPPRVDPPLLAFFSLWMGWGPLSCQISWGGDEKRGQIPRPPSTLQHFSLIAQSSSAMGFFVSINVFLCNSATV